MKKDLLSTPVSYQRKSIFPKIIIILLGLVILVLGAEAFLYIQLKVKKSQTTTTESEKSKQIEEIRSSQGLNSEEALETFTLCLQMENIDVPGFLIKVKFLSVDLENGILKVVCNNQDLPSLKLEDKTEYWWFQETGSDHASGEVSDDEDSSTQLSSNEFFSVIKVGEEIFVNIYEKEEGYYVLLINWETTVNEE